MKKFYSRISQHEPAAFLTGYGLALVSTALAALARWLLPWALTPAPYLGFYPAVVVSAALGGLGPGLVATFTSLFLVNFVFGHFNIHDQGAMMRQVIWVTASIGVSLLAGMQRKARMRERRQAVEIQRWNVDLEERVAAQTSEIRKANETLELQVAVRTTELLSANTELDDSRRAAINLLEDALDARLQAEQAAAGLRESEHRFRSFYESGLLGVIFWNMDGVIMDANDKFLEMVGYDRNDLKSGRIDWIRMTPPEYRHLDEASAKELKATGSNKQPFEKEYIRRDGSRFPIIVAGAMLDEARYNGVAFVMDIADRKLAEKSLQESEEQLRAVADSIPNLAWRTNGDGYITWYNQRWYDYSGTTPEQMEGWGWQSVHDPDELPKVLERWQASIATGEPFEMTFPLRGADGVFRPFLTRGFPLKDAAGRVLQWFGTNTDVSALKLADAQIKASLAEKDVMLREIHHRVKNNLQVISSLVSLQADALADKGMSGVFDDVRNRVRAMALVHEKLYQTGNLAQLNFADYAASLLQYLWRSHGALAEKVRLNLEVAPVALPIEEAVPCGLILNELAGNALKHAFPDGSGGEVTVGLELDPATQTVCLWVRDNGVGLPDGLDWRQSRSLGLRLVLMLAGQLSGTVETGPGPGAEFRVTFPLKGFQS
jgi:PAS domain S-box-containing protein